MPKFRVESSVKCGRISGSASSGRTWRLGAAELLRDVDLRQARVARRLAAAAP
jgi:hypothetical protein